MKEAFKIALPKLALLAVAKFAAKKDIRYYLNAVCIEVGPEESRIVATNGHAIAVYRVDAGAMVKETQSVIIPLARVESIEAPTGDGKFAATITLHVEKPADNQRFATFEDGETTMRFPLIDAKYPIYRRAMQVARTNGQPASFQTAYLLACRDAGKILDGADKFGCNFLINHNGEGPALVKFHDMNLVAVMMPIRAALDSMRSTPEWIGEFEAAPAAPGEQTDVEDDPFAGSDLARNPPAGVTVEREGNTTTVTA